MKLETSQHLYCPPQYIANGNWYLTFDAALRNSPEKLTWDTAALLSVLAFGYTTGNRTLLKEIKRQPWMSDTQPNGSAELAEIPSHGFYVLSPSTIASEFIRLSAQEIETVCQKRERIYILLSGGLDSRIVAGILAKLKHEGRLPVDPVAVTWGMDDSRDVAYSRSVAELFGFEWIHIDLGPSDLKDNIEEAAYSLDGTISPLDLHRMTWFRNVPSDALVLAGSYGDSVGRAEFSGRHLLELRGLRPVNTFGLLDPKLVMQAANGIHNDCQALFARSPGTPRFALLEHEMQGQYMRGLIAHAMNIINQYCTVYQVFTHPAVYEFMWAIHPAYRFNQTYIEVLKQLHRRLLEIPWARTNRALSGPTVGARRDLRSQFHDYPGWICGELFEVLKDSVRPDWYADTGVFSSRQIDALLQDIFKPRRDPRFFSKLLWLASFRHFVERVETLGKRVELDQGDIQESEIFEVVAQEKTTKFLRSSIHRQIKGARRAVLRYRALRQYPPQKGYPKVNRETYTIT